MMTTHDIRGKYLSFFEARGHRVVPSAALVPENDPTTLFTGSGMQPMVPYLLGAAHPSGMRLTDSQKCFRSQDIEEVGDNRHTTFFEMLGNWSLGDYFKEEQISWMFEFLTQELKLDPARLYFTCFRGNEALRIPRDTESAELWAKHLTGKGVDAKIADYPERDGMQGARIFYYDEKKNWWSRAGVPANMPEGEPGGPDTEMFYDFDPTNERKLHERSAWNELPCHVNCDCGRYIEIGNNVFMQYQKTADGFETLAQKNVDFGGGLERLAAAVSGDPDVFMIDIFAESRATIEKLSGKRYGEDEEMTRAFRVILDHLRAATFLIGDGVLPSNKDQGYFVRRLIRRAVRFGLTLGIEQDFTAAIAKACIAAYAGAYTNLTNRRDVILAELTKEEQKFRRTLAHGLKEFEKRAAGGTLTGKDAFDLFATYGFPIELTAELASEKKLLLDTESFQEEFRKHQELSRTASAGKFRGGLADHSAKVTAYHTATHLMLAALRKELGADVHQAGSNITEERTRFDFTYPEKVSREILDRVEAYVNEAIAAGATIGTTVMGKDEARTKGVEGSFWEKYPDQVTVYQIIAPDGTVFSRELCGGPHVANTKDIGAFGTFRIIKEEASSAGVRRIKAVLDSGTVA